MGRKSTSRTGAKVSPKEVFDGLQAQLAGESRSQFYYDPAGRTDFYGYNRPGAKPASHAVIWNWWRQGMMGEPPRPTMMASSLFPRRTSQRT